MRQIFIFAVVALVAGSYLARYADKTVVEAPAPQAAAVQTAEPSRRRSRPASTRWS